MFALCFSEKRDFTANKADRRISIVLAFNGQDESMEYAFYSTKSVKKEERE